MPKPQKSVWPGGVIHGCDHGDFVGMILYYPVGANLFLCVSSSEDRLGSQELRCSTRY